MKTPLANKSLPRRVRLGHMTEGKLLILPDGRIIARNLTPSLLELLKTVSSDEFPAGVRFPGGRNVKERSAQANGLTTNKK